MTSSRKRLVTAALGALIVLGAVEAEARPLFRRNVSRFGMIRDSARAHMKLRKSGVSANLERSNILANSTAAAKLYGDAWTCRNSSRMLISKLNDKGRKLVLDSSGKNAFKWGNEGWVSYHYYAVDNARRPTLLVDPTAKSNFSNDVKPGGLMRGFLSQAAARLGKPELADRIANRIAHKRFGGLLVLTKSDEISVYKSALEQAAQLRAQVARNAERH